MKKLAIVSTHPIQYNAPLFRLLSERKKILVRVFYTWEKDAEKFDEGFGKSFKWDIPLLDGYEHEFVSNNGNHSKGFWDVNNPTLVREIEKWKADAVLVYGWNYRSHLRAMRHFKGKIKVFFRGDSTLLGEQTGIKQLLRRIFLKWIYSHVDVALYVGKNNKDYFLKHGLRENQLVFAPHAIDNARFIEENSSHASYKSELLNQLGIEDDSRNIVYLGKFQRLKNLDLLINAFSQIERNGWKLILVGNGEHEEELKAMATQNPNIHFLPFQNQLRIPAVYRLGKIFCLPSTSETWGLAVNEAMACGMAVMVSNKVGCGPDLVHNGTNGFVFESGNLGDLVEKLQLVKKSDLSQMGKKSKEIISSWTFEKQAEAIEQLTLK